MKKGMLYIGVFVFLALMTTAFAADVAGKWIAPAAGVDIVLTFKVDGTTLTGTVNNPQAGETDIKDGKIDGDAVSFHVVRTINGSEMKVLWKGKVTGEEIRFAREIAGGAAGAGGGATEIIAKRAK